MSLTFDPSITRSIPLPPPLPNRINCPGFDADGYRQLMRHLPVEERTLHASRIVESAVMQVFLDRFQSGEYLNDLHFSANLQLEKDIETLSWNSITALRENLLSLAQVASVHMLTGAIVELVLDQPHRRQTFSVSRHHFSALKKNEPLLKQFFALSDVEWQVFCDSLINRVNATEQLFFVVPVKKNLRLLKALKKMLKCCRIMKSSDGNRELVIPSFSMVQLFIQIRATDNARAPVELVPVFGTLNMDDLASLKVQRKHPLALYTPEMDETNRTNRVFRLRMRKLHGIKDAGPLSYWWHDGIYHSLWEQEMTEAVCLARMRLADILKFGMQTKSNQIESELKTMRKLKNRLIEGELLHSCPSKNNPFKAVRRTIEKPVELDIPQEFAHTISDFPQQIGKLFHISSYWSRELKTLLIEDMVKHKGEWAEEFGFTPDMLEEPERLIYESLSS